MNTKDVLDAYYESSSKVSDISRQLAFAGIAIIWILRVGTDSGGIPFSEELAPILSFFVFALFIDLLQYIYKTIIWFCLNSYYLSKFGDVETEVSPSAWVNVPTNTFFCFKVGFVIFSYFHLLMYMKGQM